MVDSYNIPWLIWIQMFVFFLLLLLLCVFGILSLDISDNSCSSSDSVPSTSCSSLSRRFLPGDPIQISHHGLGFSVNSSHVQSNQMGSSQAIKGEITPAETRRVTRTEEDQCLQEKESSRNLHHHPCNLFQLAGTAFLKCLGLDRSTEETDDSLRPESKKQR
ncbi:uncharacterized protein LOC112083523 [Eutrema salsugineum]|uniref:uncharacterized protein LOC112083523 n=1 Tax=Eutrema salsugineum TaxID=72664 RepID=UPI000CED401A|nr:uncharacterized protein LOC112083523 [Eutrema salsugineum]